MKNIFFTLFILCSITFANAQTDTCTQHFKDASANFNNGQYDKAITLLNLVINNCPLDKQDKIEAYKLLVLSELNIDNLEAADKAAEKILSLDPTYKPDKLKDDVKLVTEFSKFKPIPSFSIGISGGLNMTKPQIEKTYSVVHNDDDPNLGTYKSGNGIQLAVFAEKRLIQNLWFNVGFNYRTDNYSHSLDSIIGSTVDYTERLSYFDFPVQLKYEILNEKISPFVYAGAKFSFLNSALSTTKQGDQKDLADRTSMRNSLMVGYTAGLGVSYHVRAFNILLKADYTIVPQNVNKEGTRYDDPINLFKYYYIDDDFKINHLSISIGGSYNLIYRNKMIKK